MASVFSGSKQTGFHTQESSLFLWCQFLFGTCRVTVYHGLGMIGNHGLPRFRTLRVKHQLSPKMYISNQIKQDTKWTIRTLQTVKPFTSI